MQLLVDPPVLLVRLLLVPQADPQLTLQVIDLLTVLLLTLVVSVLPSTQVLLDLLVLIDLGVK
jgi:hypothetical protein